MLRIVVGMPHRHDLPTTFNPRPIGASMFGTKPLRSLATFIAVPLRTTARLVRRGLLLYASVFGTNLPTARGRYKRWLIVFALIYILQAIPLFELWNLPLLEYWGLAIVVSGYFGVVAVNHAWYQNERIRGAIVRGQTEGDLLELPNLRGFSLLTALQLFLLFPMMFSHCHTLFALFSVPDNANWVTWFTLTFDGFCKSMLDWSEVYGVHFSQVEYSTWWAKHLVMAKRLTFDYILISGVITVISSTDTLIKGALADLRFNHRASVRLGRTIVPALITTLENEDKLMRGNAAKALGEIGDPRAVPPLILRITDTHSNVRLQATRALGNLRASTALDQIIIALLQDGSQSVKGEAARALGILGDPTAIAPLIDAMEDPTSSVRSRAAESLGMLNDPSVVQPLVHTALMDQESDVRNHARKALVAMGDHDSVTPLFIDRLNDEAPQVRCNAADALGSLHNLMALEPLVRASLMDDKEEVRASATDALRNLKDGNAVELIINALADNKVSTAVRVAEALGRIGISDPHVMEELYSLKNHSSATVSTAAQITLDTLNAGKRSKSDR